jgi:hypothetical protein
MFAGAYFVIRSVSLRDLSTRDYLNQRGNPSTATAIASMPLLEVWRVGQGFLLFLAQRRIQHPPYL